MSIIAINFGSSNFSFSRGLGRPSGTISSLISVLLSPFGLLEAFFNFPADTLESTRVLVVHGYKGASVQVTSVLCACVVYL